eukprot:TRINITY_DN22942_c0_g1_i4.p1 TRINITY_DN22942_c0_g1~~TRINITY_DN22942_c0_g1_i4.p1  ORF type:complete len:228 (+),score=29.42 TRINITY_DN22942_c0_g1_i4:68-751(+)
MQANSLTWQASFVRNWGQQLQKCVTQKKRGKKKGKRKNSNRYKNRSSSEKAKPLLFGAEASFEIEHLHSMSSAAYYHTRVQPLLKLYQSRAPRLARLQSLFTMITLLLSTGATILAAFDYQIWVPLVYGLSAFLKTFQTYHAWGPRQIAMARAVADLTTLATFWSSLTFVDRGLPSTRNYMVSVTEQAVASICQAETGAQVGQGAGKAPASGKDNSKKSEKKDAENK